MAELTMVEAINLALHQEMARDDKVVVLGQDVGVGQGVFRVTEGLLDDFGEQRVLDTPLAESAIVGTTIGMAIAGLRPVCELQFSGFSYLALHQFESHAARMRWRSRGRFSVPMVARMPYGAGAHALEHHSESKEVLFAHNPGIKVVIPSGPRSARALLVSAIRDPDPVVFMEAKALYRSFREEVPDDEESAEIGPARVLRKGSDVTLISYGTMLQRSIEAAEALADEDGVEVELLELATISPLDGDAVAQSVHSTGRAVVVHEAHRSFGPAGEIVARLVEDEFLYLEAPVRRVTGWDVMVPYYAREQDYLPSTARIVRAVRETLDF
jgi:pyruvate dehydrogenase E1 component beta subunit